MSLARKSRTISTLALIISNCVPLVGVLFFHWDQIPILMLYWFENVAIGFYTLLKLRKVGDTKYTIFFLLHYGLFTYGHFQFLFVMLSITSFFTPHPRLPSEFGMKFFSGLAIPTMALFVSHGISYWKNFIENKEYRRVTARQLLFAPYPRILAMQATILVGAALTLFLQKPFGALIVLIFAKILIDVIAHNREHNKLGSKHMV
ncbi:MAG TPA: DUF6498-containing protein [Candidatus Paceibacterota bacterium]